MGIQSALPNGTLQRYSDRLSDMFSLGSPEPSGVCSPLRSTAGSLDVQSDDEGDTGSMDECSDEEGAHGQRAIQTTSVVEHEQSRVKPEDPGYPGDSTSTIIECMAESVEDSLLNQNMWNNEMHRKVAHIMAIVEAMRKDVAALKEKVGMV
ncbi:unnamed protein product [Penicillium olsonii]|nr:unnamed protein product [Penicillium olsonii]